MNAFSPDNPIKPGASLPTSPKRSSSPEDIFLTSKKFPGVAVEPESAVAQSSTERPAGKRHAGRVAVTITVLVLVIGGIAWVVQYLPGKQQVVAPLPDSELVRFPEIKAVWDPKDEEYAFEVERDSRGSYDYYFENVHAGNVQIGLEMTSCDCSDVKVALLNSSDLRSRWQELEARRRKGDRDAVFSDMDLTWTPLDKFKGITLPEQGKGLLRVGWHARKGEGSQLRLKVGVWSYPEEQPTQRRWVYVDMLTRVVPKLVFNTGKVSLGTLSGGKASAEVVAWSATRPKLDLKVASDDPLSTWALTPLDKQSMQVLEATLRKNGLNTRVRSAVALRLTIAEEKGGKVLEQGPFQRRPSVTLEGETVQDGLPVFHGRVQGDIRIGGLDDSGKIQLKSFSISEGIRQRLYLWTDRKVKLDVDARYPAFLDARLEESLKESTEKERKWVLEVIVPRGSPPGPFGDDSAILLRTDATPPRRIRIPIQGTAVPG